MAGEEEVEAVVEEAGEEAAESVSTPWGATPGSGKAFRGPFLLPPQLW